MIAQILTVKGEVRSTNGGVVACATLLSVTDAKCGTIANEKGEFSLTIPSQPHKIIVSALGYADTLVAITTVSSASFSIVLKEKPISLPAITVRATSEESFMLGNPKQQILKKTPEEYYFLSASQPGAGIGTVFETKNKKATINTVSVFMAEDTPSEYMLSIYALGDIGVDYKLYTKNLLVPIIAKPFVFSTSKIGWVDIENLSIVLPNKYLAVFITKISENKKEQSTKNGMFPYRIGRQWPVNYALRHIYIFGDKFATLARRDDITAIYLTCQKY